jgi:hypothetical protein
MEEEEEGEGLWNLPDPQSLLQLHKSFDNKSSQSSKSFRSHYTKKKGLVIPIIDHVL